MRTQTIVSALLIVLAAGLAGPSALAALAGVNPLLIGAAVVLGVLASVVSARSSSLFIREGAEAAFEYVSQSFQPVQIGFGTSMFQRMLDAFRARATKSLGRTMVFFSKCLEFVIKASAALSAVLMLGLNVLGLGLFEGQFLGLWIVLSAILVTLLIKLSGVIGFAVQLANLAPPLGFSTLSGKTKRILAITTVSSIAVWFLFALEWWLLFQAFGSSTGLIGTFLITALVTLFALTPFTLNGIGIMEIVGMLAFSALGIPFAVTFLCLIVWEVVRLISDSVAAFLSMKSQLARYR